MQQKKKKQKTEKKIKICSSQIMNDMNGVRKIRRKLIIQQIQWSEAYKYYNIYCDFLKR